MDHIKNLNLSRLRANSDIPSIGDHLLYFEDLKMLPQINEPRRMSYVLVGLCTGGEGGYDLDQENYQIKKGDALIFTEGQIVNNVWMTEKTEGFALLISKDLMDEMFKEIKAASSLFLLAREHSTFPLNKNEIEKTKQYMSLIKERILAPNYEYKNQVIRMLLIAMVYDLATAITRVMKNVGKNPIISKGQKLFTEFINLLEKNYHTQRRVSWYAEQMGLSPKYLSEIISSTSKRTPNHWIDKYVTNEIRNLLTNTDLKIRDIAKEMHFPSQSFLGKYFKENVGVSPSEYRSKKDAVIKD